MIDDDNVDSKPTHGNVPRGRDKGVRKPRRIPRIRLEDPDDDVGYGRPPRAHQFKPGQSGNPRGRPKGKKNEATILNELLFKKIKIQENGRERSISLFEAVLRRFAQESLKGNIKAAAFLLGRYNAISTGDLPRSDLNDDDRKILKAYAQDLLSKIEEET